MFHRLGVNANVGWTFVARLASALSGFISIFPVVHFLTPIEQGYYYTFASIIALQVLFELGLTQILVQVTSHEFPFLAASTQPSDHLDTIYGQRLSYFAGFARQWYGVTSWAFCVVGSVAGVIYFGLYGSLPARDWLVPWLALIALTSVNLYISPRFAFVEGAGFPGKVAALRLQQTLIGYAILIVALCAGLGLWAVISVPMTQVALGIRWLRRDRTVVNFFRRDMRVKSSNGALRREIFDLQWRVAMSWVGGYLATLIFTPMLFAYQGAAAAGRWGLTFSLMSQLTALGSSFTTAHAPRFGALIARGERHALDREFRQTSVKTVALVTLGCLALIGAVWAADYLRIEAANRVVGLRDMVLIAVATVAAALVACLATYMRAHKEEPLAASSLVIGAATGLSAWAAARHGITQVALAYLIVTAALNLPWRYIIYRRYRARTSPQ